MASRPAGYSGTALAKKLGIGAGSCVLPIEAPKEYRALLAAHLQKLRPAIRPDAALWVSWPKKAAKVPTDITEDTIRALALPLGLVDVKVCAVSEVWSALKLVVRKSER